MTTLHPSTNSDTILTNLEPLESTPFDISNLNGFQAHHLNAIVKLAFVKDSPQRSTKSCGASSNNQPQHQQQLSETTSQEAALLQLKDMKERSEILIRELEHDLSVMIEEDLTTFDHNADKKAAVESVLRQGQGVSSSSSEMVQGLMVGISMTPATAPTTALSMTTAATSTSSLSRLSSRRGFRAVSVDSADTENMAPSNYLSANPGSVSEMNLNSDIDRLSQIGSQTFPSLSQHQQTNTNPHSQGHQHHHQRYAPRPEVQPCHKSDLEMESSLSSSSDFAVEFPTVSSGEMLSTLQENVPNARTVPPSSRDDKSIHGSSELTPHDLSLEREILGLKFSSMQLCSVKTLSVVASSEKFAELLLVPKNSQQERNGDEKQLFDSLGILQDEDMKMALKQMMKILVGRSTHTSPFRRAVPLMELERAFSVFHNSIIQSIAEEKLEISTLEGILNHSLYLSL